MANGYSSSCKGGSNCESKIILMKTRLPRKSQSDGFDTMALIPCEILALIHHVKYASMDVEVKA